MKQRLRFLFSCACELSVLLAASMFLLSACGGGGGAGATAGSNSGNGNMAMVPSQTGAVSAVLAPSANGQAFFLVSNSVSSSGSTASFVQAAGPLSSLYVYAISGTPAVTQDIAGDANFTMGRWIWGTVTNTSTNAVMETMNGSMANTGWHYLLVNKLSALPTTGTMACDAGTFTHPTYVVYGSSAANMAVTTASNAMLSFSASGASFSFTLNTTMGGATQSMNISKTNVGTGSVLIGNGIGGGAAGGMGMLSDAGGGAIRIGGLYTNYQNSGFYYYGTFSFLCQ